MIYTVRTKKLTNEDKPVGIEQDSKYPEMYRLKWADGVLSEDFYNKTRAHDMLLNYDLYRMGMKMRGNSRPSMLDEIP